MTVVESISSKIPDTTEAAPLAETVDIEMETWGEIKRTIGSAVEAPEDRDVRITVLAVAFHELWVRTRRTAPDGALYADGRLVSRMKPTTDEGWIDRHGGENQVDIANKFFPELPDDWQAENLAAAEVIDTLVQEMGGAENLDLSNEEMRRQCGAVIHDKWLERNAYAKGGVLDVPFEQLSADEQDKDLVQLEFALAILTPDKSATPARPWMTQLWQTMNNWALDRGLPMRATSGEWIDPESFYYRDQVALRSAGLR